MISETNIEKVKKLIKEETRPVVILSQNDEFNRKILEYGKFDILLSVDKTAGKSGLRQTDSGFNHVLAKIAAKNSVALGIDLDEISRLDKSEKAARLAKIIQNIKTCRKAGCRLAVLSKGKRQPIEFLLSLGASSEQAKKAIYF